MASVELPSGETILVDDEDLDLVNSLNLYLNTKNGYAYYYLLGLSRDENIPRTLHSLLLGKRDGLVIDHINEDKLDNRRANLRHITHSENLMNRKSANRNNTSGVSGVDRLKVVLGSRGGRPWRARIYVRGKTVNLGRFHTKKEAVMARKEAERTFYPHITVLEEK